MDVPIHVRRKRYFERLDKTRELLSMLKTYVETAENLTYTINMNINMNTSMTVYETLRSLVEITKAIVRVTEELKESTEYLKDKYDFMLFRESV